jgi:hypothetical protein
MVVANAKARADDSVLRVASVGFLFQCAALDSFYEIGDVLQSVGVHHDSHLCEHARYGAHAGQPNPRFLDAQLFKDLVLTPYGEKQFESHTGPFIFKFQRHGLSVNEFCSRLDKVFSQLPKEFKYAVQFPNTGLLGSE